jgi:hypothetical protein
MKDWRSGRCDTVLGLQDSDALGSSDTRTNRSRQLSATRLTKAFGIGVPQRMRPTRSGRERCPARHNSPVLCTRQTAFWHHSR